MRAQLEFKPQDLWVGIYWDVRWECQPPHNDDCVPQNNLHIWVCLVPMLPIHLTIKYAACGLSRRGDAYE